MNRAIHYSFAFLLFATGSLFATSPQIEEFKARKRVIEESNLSKRRVDGFYLSPHHTAIEINQVFIFGEHHLEFPNLLEEFLQTVLTDRGNDITVMRRIYRKLIEDYLDIRKKGVLSGDLTTMETLHQLDSLILNLIIGDVRRVTKNKYARDLMLLNNTLSDLSKKWDAEVPSAYEEPNRLNIIINQLSRRAIQASASGSVIGAIIFDDRNWSGKTLQKRIEEYLPYLANSLQNGSSPDFLNHLASQSVEFFLVPNSEYEIVYGLLPSSEGAIHQAKKFLPPLMPDKARLDLISKFFKEKLYGKREMISDFGGHQESFLKLMKIANRSIAESKEDRISELQFLVELADSPQSKLKMADHIRLYIRLLVNEKLNSSEYQKLFEVLDRINISELNDIRVELSNHAFNKSKDPIAWTYGAIYRHGPNASFDSIQASAAAASLEIRRFSQTRPTLDQAAIAFDTLNKLRVGEVRPAIATQVSSFEALFSGLAGINIISETLETLDFMVHSIGSSELENELKALRLKQKNMKTSQDQNILAADIVIFYTKVYERSQKSHFSNFIQLCQQWIASLGN